MMRRFPMSIRLSLLLLALAATAASAQRSAAPADTVAIAQTDSVRPSGGNWLVALLKKIARRSDDTVATSDGDVETAATESASLSLATRRVFTSRRDSLAYESARATADRASGYRVVVDIFAHQLYVIDGGDTLYAAPVATAMNATLTYGKKSWRFETPRGVRKVLSQDK